jgi:hypothetical protein
MPVRDDRARYRPQGIDVKISRRTVEAFGTRNDQIHRGMWRGLSGSVRVICTIGAKTSLPRRVEVSKRPSANDGRSRASCVFFEQARSRPPGSWGTSPGGLIHGLMTARIPWSQGKMQGISWNRLFFAKFRLKNISGFRCLRMNSLLEQSTEFFCQRRELIRRAGNEQGIRRKTDPRAPTHPMTSKYFSVMDMKITSTRNDGLSTCFLTGSKSRAT